MKYWKPQEIRTGRLSLQYAIMLGAYWSAFCAVYSFATVLLKDKGFTSSTIGICVAVGNILGVLFQPVFAGIADRSKKLSLLGLTTILCLAAAFFYGCLSLVPSQLIAVAFLFCLSDALMQIIQPLTNSVSVYYVNEGVSLTFGIARSVGSVSFAVVSALMGVVVEHFGTIWIVLTGVFFILLMALMFILMPRVQRMELPDAEQMTVGDAKKRGILEFVRKYPSFFVALLGITLLFAFHNMTNIYLIDIAKNVGGSSAELGIALAISATVEMPTMIFYTKLTKKLSPDKLLAVSGVFFVLKAITYVFVCNIGTLYANQLLQMCAFALYMPASVHYVNEVMEPADKFKGQAVMVSTNTLGGLIGSAVGGFLIDSFGVRVMLIVGVGLTLIGTLILSAAILPGYRRNCSNE